MNELQLSRHDERLLAHDYLGIVSAHTEVRRYCDEVVKPSDGTPVRLVVEMLTSGAVSDVATLAKALLVTIDHMSRLPISVAEQRLVKASTRLRDVAALFEQTLVRLTLQRRDEAVASAKAATAAYLRDFGTLPDDVRALFVSMNIKLEDYEDLDDEDDETSSSDEELTEEDKKFVVDDDDDAIFAADDM